MFWADCRAELMAPETVPAEPAADVVVVELDAAAAVEVLDDAAPVEVVELVEEPVPVGGGRIVVPAVDEEEEEPEDAELPGLEGADDPAWPAPPPPPEPLAEPALCGGTYVGGTLLEFRKPARSAIIELDGLLEVDVPPELEVVELDWPPPVEVPLPEELNGKFGFSRGVGGGGVAEEMSVASVAACACPSWSDDPDSLAATKVVSAAMEISTSPAA